MAATTTADSGTGGGSTGPSDTSGLLAKIEDTSKSAKRGGVMKWVQGNEPLHFDGQSQGQVQLNIYNGLAYESLVRNKPGDGQPSSYNEVLPNLAESWEFSPDKTTITFKLRQGVKWQNVAPVNGRAFDSSDVVASLKRYAAGTGNVAAQHQLEEPHRADRARGTAPDPNTVVYKLKEPTSFIMQRLANMITGEVGAIYPKEADNGFDTTKGQIGTGGFMLDTYTPSGSIVYKRNPDYWNKEAAFPDTLEIPFVSPVHHRGWRS